MCGYDDKCVGYKDMDVGRGGMSYYKNFASYEDGIVGAKGFYVKVVDMDGKEYISSAIPIDHIDLVLFS